MHCALHRLPAMESAVPLETYLLSLRPDDALALCVLAVSLGCTSGVAISIAAFGKFVSPRVKG